MNFTLLQRPTRTSVTGLTRHEFGRMIYHGAESEMKEVMRRYGMTREEAAKSVCASPKQPGERLFKAS